ncbi:hypothetical protein RHA1_ro09144 (plasmid) [Rhodococcus jostii RHA1]|uniref:Uncharacterized protein n=1 Tax=Rhodococcus jostii (strain RHA1) TaxID=101510 RepID=Q0RWZ9_RHOJR|nr:hypothetical protein RHA1_ro09144 [Rhodococcus jostii RHA1]
MAEPIEGARSARRPLARITGSARHLNSSGANNAGSPVSARAAVTAVGSQPAPRRAALATVRCAGRDPARSAARPRLSTAAPLGAHARQVPRLCTDITSWVRPGRGLANYAILQRFSRPPLRSDRLDCATAKFILTHFAQITALDGEEGR